MRRTFIAVTALAAFASAAAGFAGCLSPTLVDVVVTTDVPCAHLRGAAISVGKLGGDGGIEDRPPSSTKTECDSEGNIGSVIVIPSGSDDSEIAFRVVVGVDRSPDSCGANGEGCIIARRALHFLPHERLTVPIAMRGSCVGVPCTPDTTCVSGACVSATFPDPAACEGDGCPENLLPPLSGDAGVDGSFEGGARDASSDGAISDTGGSDVVVGDASIVTACGDMSGLQAGAAWPMDGYCPANRRRSPYAGPQKTPQPTVKWQSVVRAADSEFSPLIGADGTVFKMATNAVYAYDGNSGAETTRFNAPEMLEWASAIGSDGTLYVPGASKLFKVGLDGGFTSIDLAARGNLLIGPGPSIILTDPVNDLVAYDTTLTQRWLFSTGASVDFMTPMLAPNGNVYVASNDGTLFAVASADGGGASIGSLGASNSFLVAFAPDGRLRVSSQAAQWVRSITTAGSVQWTSPDAGTPGEPVPFGVGDDSTIYVPHHQGELVAIRADGSIKWTTQNAPDCTAITIGADGLVYSGCAAGVFAFSPVDGTVVWSVPLTSGLAALSIGPNGYLYVNGEDNVLYAIGN